MIYLKCLLSLIWFIIKAVLVFAMFFPTLFIDLIIGPLVYYIATGRSYYMDFDPLAMVLCVCVLIGNESNMAINDTVLRLFIKKK